MNSTEVSFLAAHNMTVVHMHDSDKPAANAACRAGACPRPADKTFPFASVPSAAPAAPMFGEHLSAQVGAWNKSSAPVRNAFAPKFSSFASRSFPVFGPTSTPKSPGIVASFAKNSFPTHATDVTSADDPFAQRLSQSLLPRQCQQDDTLPAQLQVRPRRMMTLSRLHRGSHRARKRRARSPCAPSRCRSARIHRLRSPPNQLRKALEFSRLHIRLASNRRRVRPSGPAVRQYLQALSMTDLHQARRLFPVAHRLVRRDSRHALAHQQ
jgi:hypothetical protein